MARWGGGAAWQHCGAAAAGALSSPGGGRPPACPRRTASWRRCAWPGGRPRRRSCGGETQRAEPERQSKAARTQDERWRFAPLSKRSAANELQMAIAFLDILNLPFRPFTTLEMCSGAQEGAVPSQKTNKGARAGAIACALITAPPGHAASGHATVGLVRALALLAAATGLLRGLLGLLLDRLLRHFLWAGKKAADVRWELGGAGMSAWRPRAEAGKRAAAAPTPGAHTTLLQRMHRQSALPQALTGERLVDGRGMRCLITRRRRGSCPPSSGRTARRRPGKDQQTIRVRHIH